MEVKKESGVVDVPVYMKDYTEKKEYKYTISYKGFEGYVLKLNSKWWIVSYSKWVVMGKDTKKKAQEVFKDFVDEREDTLREKGFI